MKDQYFTQNVFVGIANDYNKRITSYPYGEELFKGKPGHDSYYAGFINTPLGLQCLQNGKIYPVYEEHVYIKKDFACDVESILFYMQPDEVPPIMTEGEIKSFVANVYAPAKREEHYKNIRI